MCYSSCMTTTEPALHCKHCDADLPASQFYKDRKRKSGYTAYCKAYYADYYAKNTERQKRNSRNAQLKRLYGVTKTEYDALMAQGCSICAKTTEDGVQMVLDHDHATDSVRAPLCSRCNTMLGMATDSPIILRAAADYLESHRAVE